MSQIVFFGIDLGTTNTKVIAVKESGEFIASARRATDWIVLPNGRIEADANLLYKKVVECINELVTTTAGILGQFKVAGIGITGMAESGVILDKDNKILSQPIAWFDSRGEAEMNSLGDEFRKEYQSKTGLVFKPESSLSSLLSMKSEGFDFKQKGIVWLNLLEYVAFLFTGTKATEPSLASRTALLDQSNLKFWQWAKELLSVDESFIPEQRFCGQSWGGVNTKELPEQLQKAQVTVAGHDHGVGAIGSGATGVDQIFNSAGTADVIYRSVPGTLSDEQRFALTELGVSAGRHALKDATSLIGGSRGGLVLRRALDLLGARDGEKLQEIDKAWDANHKFKDVIDMSQGKSISNDIKIVLTGDAHPNDLWAAALDYMSSENKKMLNGISAVVGEHKTALGSGGWLKLRSVREIKSSVIANLTFSSIDEPGAFGAAFIASWTAQGGDSSLVDHVGKLVAKLNSEYRI
jgi:sugar (pentulose or hexulose) kinase